MALEQAQSFLILRLGAIGDVLRVCPAVERLRKARPDAEIGWALEDWVAPLAACCPHVDRLHLLDRRKLYGGWSSALDEIRRFIYEIRACQYEVVLDFHGRLKSGLVSWFSGAPTRIGYARGQSTEKNHLFSNRHVKLEDPLENRVKRFLDLLEPLGISSEFKMKERGLKLPQAEVQAAKTWYIGAGRPHLAVYAGCSAHQSGHHRWPKEKWIALLRQLGERKISSVLFWGPDEAELTRYIAMNAGESCFLAPKTGLIEMMSMLGEFSAFIGSNTAAMHMSWLQGVPVVFFPGPADPKTDGPMDASRGFPLQAGHLLRKGVSKRYQADVTTAVSVEEAFSAVLKCFQVAHDNKVIGV